MAENLITKTIKISFEDVENVIGKGEKNLKFIIDESNCEIVISDFSSRQSACEITGTKTNIERALDLIREAISNPNQTVVVNIPLTKCPALVGKKGKTITRLQEQFNVEMSLPNGDNFGDTKPLTITGKGDKVEAAQKMIQDFIKRNKLPIINLNAQNVKQQSANAVKEKKNAIQKGQVLPKTKKPTVMTSSVRIKLNRVKAVLGENGEILKEICKESGAKIHLSKKPPLNEFIVTGTAAQIRKGEKLIRLKATSNQSSSFNNTSNHGNNLKDIRPTFECCICFEAFYIEEGCVTCEANATTVLDEKHSICIDCLQGYAHSAITDIPVAFGGTGLKCALPECKNIFVLSTFEIYLSDENYLPLKLRLQEQCLADASLEDLATCPECGYKLCVPLASQCYRCICGRLQCKSCPRLFDVKHVGKTCTELDIEEENAKGVSAQKLDTKLSEAIIRKCHKCGIAFVKNDGCNKMQCRCGAKQCYVCREKDIDYGHFCRCGQIDHGKCKTCQKSCKLFENAEELDQIKIIEMQRQHQFEQKLQQLLLRQQEEKEKKEREKQTKPKSSFLSKISNFIKRK